MKPARNDPCPCGSGKKFKKCCQAKFEAAATKKEPTTAEVNQLVALFNAKNYVELEVFSRLMLEQYPDFGVGWKALGISLSLQGKLAVPALQKAVVLLPDDVEAHSNLGNALQVLGQFEDAVASYRCALQIKPDYADAHFNLGIAQNSLGQLEGAVISYRRALQFNPGYAEAHFNLGIALKDLGQLDDAVASFRGALQSKPDYAEAHVNLGAALKDLGQLDDAVASYRRALQFNPDNAEAHYNLGVALNDLGQFDDAVASYRRALQSKPDFAEAHFNLGNAQKELGRLDDAVASYRRALQSKSDYAEAHYNLGVTLNELGQPDDAVASYRRALQSKPDFAVAHVNLGNAQKEFGQFDEAVASYRRALQSKPDYAEAHVNLGNALKALGQLDDAVASYHRALQLNPDYAEVHYNLGISLKELGQLDDAVASYRRALQSKPDLAEAHVNLGVVHKDLGQLDDAVASYRLALQIKPDYAIAFGSLLYLYGYHALIDPFEYLSLAREWELACVPEKVRQQAHDRIFNRLPLAGRRLRVGYVSGDFNKHAVSYFIKQLFVRHDKTRIELFAYYTNAHRDTDTERLQTLVEHWIPLAGMTDAKALERIGADEIDVLIDLSGHTMHNRLGIFARRAAPVQTHYLGYFASTGLTEMDYWIGDNRLTPLEAGRHFSEQIWQLPRVWVCYDGKTDAPVPSWQPSQDGVVWLGSFNNLGKLTPSTLALWARVLHALPEGRLLLKTKELKTPGNRQRILDTLFTNGIAPERIELQDGSVTPDWHEHMAYYDRLDIALDPVGGVGGGTTTCDALWMGVPVITLEGDRMALRMTAAMLNAISCTEWIAHSEAEYIDKVVALARDVEQRKMLRFGQRNQMASSPLCNTKDLATSLENAYFEMFERWLGKEKNKQIGLIG